MSISTHSPRSALHDTVFVKTAKGRAEMTARSAGLKSRQRTLLIMLDGQKRLGDIAGLSEAERVQTIRQLLALELAAPLTGGARIATPVPQATPATAETAATVATAATAEKLAGIKALMTDSANTYLGLMASDVVRRVQAARDETELLSVVGHWHMAMRESKYGREAAETYLEHIRTRFGAVSGDGARHEARA